MRNLLSLKPFSFNIVSRGKQAARLIKFNHAATLQLTVIKLICITVAGVPLATDRS